MKGIILTGILLTPSPETLFPMLNSNMVNDPNYIFLQYTTDEALSTDVEGGKYLFRRTA